MKVKKGCVNLKEERNKKRKWGEKGESYEKGGKEKRLGGAMGSMGNRYEVFQRLKMPGRQREQECGCCPPLGEEGFRAT